MNYSVSSYRATCTCAVCVRLLLNYLIVFFTSRKLLYQQIMIAALLYPQISGKHTTSRNYTITNKRPLSCVKELVSEVKCPTRGDWYSLTLSQALVRFDCGMFLCGLLRNILSAISAIPFVGYIWVIFSIEYQLSAYSVFSSHLNGTFIPRCDKVSPQS